MSDLPEDRLHCSSPFAYVGLDVFGPYEVFDGINTRRTHAAKKSWAVIFTCLNSRATHIEPLPILDVNSIKNALRRLFCIRGLCIKLRSDRGTNFTAVKYHTVPLSMFDLEDGFKEREWELNTPG